jgi:hypothetical protein
MNAKKEATSAQEIAGWFSYDEDSGKLFWRRSPNRRKPVGSLAGCLSLKTGRWVVSVCGKHYLAHRVVWAIKTGAWPKLLIDHINGDPLDNRFENLRDVTHSTNMQNIRKAYPRSKTGVLGVHLEPNSKRYPYFAGIRVDGKKRVIGRYKTVQEAQSAYLDAKRSLHEGNTL